MKRHHPGGRRGEGLPSGKGVRPSRWDGLQQPSPSGMPSCRAPCPRPRPAWRPTSLTARVGVGRPSRQRPKGDIAESSFTCRLDSRWAPSRPSLGLLCSSASDSIQSCILPGLGGCCRPLGAELGLRVCFLESPTCRPQASPGCGVGEI